MEDSPNSFNKLNKIQKLLKEETSIRKLCK